MNEKLKLVITTPYKTFFEGKVSIVTFKTSEGYIGVQKNSQPLITTIQPSKLFINFINSEDKKICAISGGIAFINKKEVKIITDGIELKEEINLERAEFAKNQAKKLLEDKNLKSSEKEYYLKKLLKAKNRIDVKKGRDSF